MEMNRVMVLLLLLLWFLCFSSVFLMTTASVILIVNNVTFSFDDIEASFAPAIRGSGECGVLYLANPLDGCSDLSNKVDKGSNVSSPFALVIRGGCSFEDKVRRVQKAGFKAAIVYDNDDDDDDVLVAMAGNAAGIKIHAVFVSKASGEILKKYAGLTYMELWLIPSFENSAWSIMAISFVSLLAMSAVLATCFFVRRHRIRRERPQSSRVREFHGMSRRLVKAMPSLIFTAVLEDNCTSRTCAICLEDYTVGEKLRILPCRHKFHAFCVDSWLTTWRTFCPVCKRDARTSTGDPPASESTPLLSSTPSSVASSALSYTRSSLASSLSAIRIAPAASPSPSISHSHSRAGTPYIQQSLRSYHQSPSMSFSRSSVDLRNASSQRSRASHLVSPASLNYPSISPLNTRYMSPYFPSPSNESPGLVSSSGHLMHHPLHCSESAASFSPFASAHTLPEC
ncbi:Receptor-like proteiny region, transmembrane domain- and RING domain-containing protein 2 [Hibiscus syriacus]|uniref:Receptor-like proteiny region, transmembrane domain-and RING domain-containing protein 2 n=1 Tax=Hibiscus syriacus TaxID=106335 RepID=A0A6A3AB26_HIBSY|nr:receptor homology region, transmembrane domain- and RING domain-containing protein 2-like [Hibiscus syriacus]KAE8701650.1 Receptor-like proteiny region, transmembrane domain- and RING domain-containing protein 2 [Hibiscus syriacus]